MAYRPSNEDYIMIDRELPNSFDNLTVGGDLYLCIDIKIYREWVDKTNDSTYRG